MAASSALRHVARLGCAALAAVLAAASAAGAQPATAAPACAPPAGPWVCVGALAPDSLFQAIEATPSPDGTRFVYSRAEGDSRQLWLVDRVTGAERRLTQGRGDRRDPVWSPDGSRILFTGEIPGPLGRQARGVAVVDAATGAERLVAATPPSAMVGSVGWTPGGRILFSFLETMETRSHGPPPQRLLPLGAAGGWWTADADGADPVRVRWSNGLDRPAFSPRGDEVAWIGWRCGEREGQGIWISGAEGGEARCIHPLPQAAGWRGRLAWPHPDTLLYAGPLDTHPDARLYLLTADGRSLLPLADEAVTGMGVARDGSVAVSVHRQRSRVALLPAAGGEPVPLPLPAGERPDALWPEWHPSGRELAFTAVPRRAWLDWDDASLVRIPLSSGGTEASPPGGGAEVAPERHDIHASSYNRREHRTTLTGTWSPDGLYLATYDLLGGVGIGAEYGVARGPRLDTAAVVAGFTDPAGVGGPPAWSRDGTHLLVPTGSQAWRLQNEPWSLMWVRVDSVLQNPRDPYAGNYRRIPLEGFGGRAVRPRVSPDGAWIAFAGQPGPERRGGVYVVPAQGGTVRVLAEFSGNDLLTGPEWSARGDSVYFSSPDASGTYQLRRGGRDGGAAETLTAHTEHVLHPRLAPDGRTLAVTLLDVRTELWMLPRRFPPLPPPPQAPPALPAAGRGVDAAEISPGLLQVVRSAEARPRELRRLWPGFWDGGQVYAVRTGVGETAEALIVSPHRRSPAGFTPVDGAGLPPALSGRLYHARGLPANVHPEETSIPVVWIPDQAAQNPAVLRERLRTLFDAAFDSVAREGFPSGADPGCPTADPRSCAVQARVGRAILQRALRSRGGAQRELMRDYAAIVSIAPGELWHARHLGIQSYVATRAAYAATGTDPAGYRADLAARLADTAPPGPGHQAAQAEAITRGEAVAALLDRLGRPWHERVAAGEPLVDALLRAVELSPAQAIARAPTALRRHGFHALLAALPDTAGVVPGQPAREAYWLTALRTLVPRTPAIQIDLQAGVATDEFRFEYDAGPAGAGIPEPGFVVLPDPARVRIRAGDVSLDVRGHPMAVITRPGTGSQHVRIVVYPRADLTDLVKPEKYAPEAGQRVQAEGLDLRIGPGASVCPCAEIYIRPALP